MTNPLKSNYLLTLFVFIATALLMAIYEATKQLILGNISLWESHAITIVFTSTLAAILSLLIFRLKKSLSDINVELMAKEIDCRSIFNATPDPTIICNKQGVILMVSQQIEQLLGYKPEEIIGQPVEVVVPHRFKAKHPEHVENFVASPIARPMGARRKVHALRKDGSEIDVEISLSPISISKGTIYASSLRDTSERNRIEKELRIAAAAFETHEAIMITDTDSNIIRVNHAFEKITGYRAEEVLGMHTRILKSGRHDQNFYIEMWQKLMTAGVWEGEIWDRHKSGNFYPKDLTITAVKDEYDTTTQYVAIFTDISKRKQAEGEIQKLAFYDMLTNLPNRRLLLDRLNLALTTSARNKQYGALLFLDLDKFKDLNDTLGHEYGDELLIEVAKRITLCLREIDTVARLGGDEFVVVIENLSDKEEEASRLATEIAEKIRKALVVTYQLKEHTHHSSPSIGVCLFFGHNDSINELLKRADIAMYQAKNSGRNAIRLFEPYMQESLLTPE